jgi:hypothetical protein
MLPTHALQCPQRRSFRVRSRKKDSTPACLAVDDETMTVQWLIRGACHIGCERLAR